MTVAPVPIHEGRDFYVPVFQVEISDRKLQREVILDVTHVTYWTALS
jgi:hypothetical protein